jgi:hypothetical protein
LKVPIGNGNFEFSGILGDKIFISLFLRKSKDSFTGYYRNLRHPQKLVQVAGTLTEDGSFAMRALNESGTDTSIKFRGSVVKEKISGRWGASSSSLGLPFILYVQGFPQ